MKIDVAYMAKDGRRFSSAKECEKYEKQLGTEAGTVARACIDLKELGEKSYVFGLLKVRHGGENYYRTYATRCIDDKLADYVNVSELDADKRWIRNTIADVLRDMEHFDDDDLCEYEFLYCDNWEFNKHTFGCIRTHNQELWKEMEKAAKADAENAKNNNSK